MKYILILFSIITTSVYGQTSLNFDKRFIDCEDKWIALKSKTDSIYGFGFIYIDATAGLTLDYLGTFTISSNGTFIPKKVENASFKKRLEPNQAKVAIIPTIKLKELDVLEIPDWLKIYKTDTSSVERLYRYGFIYNGWNECAKGLSYLERAEKTNPDFNRLAVELAFSYNCLNQFDKAILVLQKALVNNPADAYINKELIYAQIKSGQLDKASETCKKAIAVCKDQSYNSENCYNLLHSFFEKKDKINFTLWLSETKKWASKNERMIRSITFMENEFAK